MPSPFSPVPVVHHADVVGAADSLPVVVRTDPRPWAYALAFLRRPAGGGDGAIAARVHVQVTDGAIGVGLLDRAEARFLDETVVPAGAAPVVVELLGDTDAGTGPLIVRNASAAGASQAAVLALDGLVFASSDDWPASLSDPPISPGWARFYGTRRDTLDEKARSRRFAAMEAPTVIRWSDGMRFEILPDDHLSRVVFVSGTYEPHSLRVLRAVLSPGDTFIDAGANAGIVSLAAGPWVGSTGRVLAIEPSGREFQRLVAHLELNGLANVIPVRAAVACRPGSRSLQVASLPRSGLNTLGVDFSVPGAHLSSRETVDAITIDALAARHRVERVRAIKLDVEGAELEAIDGAPDVLRTHRPAMVLEVCARALDAAGASVSALEERLRGFGYVLFEIDDDVGQLVEAPSLASRPDRNVVALPVERARADAETITRRAGAR